MSPPVQKPYLDKSGFKISIPFFNKAHARYPSLFLIVSISLHLIFGIGASYWIVQEIQNKKKVVFSASPSGHYSQRKTLEHRVSIPKKKLSTPKAIPLKRITVDMPSPKFTLPTLPNLASTNDFSPIPMQGIGRSNLHGKTNAISNHAFSKPSLNMGNGLKTHDLTINLFGIKVETKKLGVLLDVSLSTHRLLKQVVETIDREFEHCTIILVPGCGIKEIDRDGKIYTYQAFQNILIPQDIVPKDSNIHVFLNTLKVREPSIMATFDEISKLGKLHVLEASTIGKKEHHVYKTSQCASTHVALEYLMKQRVDAIYWFADFNDPISQDDITKWVERLKTNHIKVYLKVFDGKVKEPYFLDLSTQTGGSYSLEKMK